MLTANEIAARVIVSEFSDMENFDQLLAMGDITSDNIQDLIIRALEETK